MTYLNIPVLVGSLGYFVDIYDLVLFSVVRVQSLTELGVSPADQLSVGVMLLNWQMTGMLAGGVIWGVLGDRVGRRSVLFGSIFMYSVATFANGFVHHLDCYAWIRLIAGFGLAGELGAAVTLVCETLSARARTYGTMLVACVGLLGAVVAATTGDKLPWRHSYFIGGGLGFVLLLLRIKTAESDLFLHSEKSTPRKSLLLFLSPQRIGRYLCCIAVGLPTYFVASIVTTFSPELSRALSVKGAVTVGQVVIFSYIGTAAGDILAGLASHFWGSRKAVIALCLTGMGLLVGVFLFSSGLTVHQFYWLCLGIGIAGGYWAVFITAAAEQFGTNLRATVATTVPNFVRASAIPLTLALRALTEPLGLVSSAKVLGAITLLIALGGLIAMKESFGRELDYLEV
ncbi:MAG: MFS transporter [Deltaproteobacteria bacterium]|nr:MFS transporter [Deltaproteobacteria bacterium]